MLKKLSLAVIPILALTLSACSSAVTAPEEDITSSDPNIVAPEGGSFNAVEVPVPDENMMYDTVPHVYNVTAEGFTFVDGGSSSCVKELETVEYDEESNSVVMTYAQLEEGVMCTQDFVLSAKNITLTGQEIIDTTTVGFTIDGAPVDRFAETVSSAES